MVRVVCATLLFVIQFIYIGCGTTSRAIPAANSDDDSIFVSAPEPAPSLFPDKVMNESTKHWIRRWHIFEEEASGVEPNGIVLLGDSMTERFPMDRVSDWGDLCNRGIGGDKIGGWKYYGVIDRLDLSVCDLKPKVVVMNIGVNDIVFANTPMENMKENYQRVVSGMKECRPDTTVVLLSILPVRTTNKEFNPRILEFNQYVEGLAKRNGCLYVDLHSLYLDENNELREELASDTIHLTEDGYTPWIDKVGAVIESLR